MSLHAHPSPDAHPPLADHERTPCEVWTRVMGYHRPMASFNIGKQGEFNERRYFVEPTGLAGGCAPLVDTTQPVVRPAAACTQAEPA